jgi:hypothetical protein
VDPLRKEDAVKRRMLWLALLALPLAAAGLTLVGADPAPAKEAYICPLTGEKLPCPECCPIKK